MIDESRLIPARGRVLVALSGGPDSTALLIALAGTNRQVVAAHYDHALRTDSAEDATAVRGLCENLHVPLLTERRTTPLPRGSVQAAARTARYEFLERARIRAHADVIATAHTLDDHVETILINLLRGTGLRGLGGIPRARSKVVRPLLTVRRAEILEYLNARSVEGLDDPSNRDRRYLRVRVRHELLPTLEQGQPAVRDHLVALANTTLRALDHLDEHLPSAERAALEQAPAPARARALTTLYKLAAAGAPPLSRRHIDALDTLVRVWRPGATYDLPRSVRFRLDANRAIVSTTTEYAPEPPPRYHLVERTCPGCSQPDAVHLKAGHLELGHRSPGLRLRPANATGTRKLQDVLVDAKVPATRRDALPLVFRNGRLAWVPGVAFDVEYATDQTKPGLHVEVHAVE